MKTVTHVVRKLRMLRAIRSDRRGLIEMTDRGSKQGHASAMSHRPRTMRFSRRKQRSSRSGCAVREKSNDRGAFWPNRMSAADTRTHGARQRGPLTQLTKSDAFSPFLNAPRRSASVAALAHHLRYLARLANPGSLANHSISLAMSS